MLIGDGYGLGPKILQDTDYYMNPDRAQILLIIAGIVVAAFFGAFLVREMYPEYKIYQNDYIALEEFRSTYTHEQIPPFHKGIKQIVIEREDKGPQTIDRCISCHVALEIPYFSPTKIARDQKGDVIRSENGDPLLVPNEDYIWSKLDEKITALRNQKGDEKVIKQLEGSGETRVIGERLQEAERYASLKTASIGNQVYDVTKVLQMHPLIGEETYPFEYHPVEEYGCTVCHSGNGRGLVTDKAHGPVFDGRYETEDLGWQPWFTEKDPKNDPLFSKMFNHKPGESLIFQTEPLFIGPLIQAKCVQCHMVGGIELLGRVDAVEGKTEVPSKNPLLTELTKDYQRGRGLYISQGCYACHQISQFSRGGVGPDLTRAGDNYPWYLKRKMIWPQGDLHTSTMPNMRLDTSELQDLMVFLLGQKGGNRSIATTDYKAGLRAFESGKKMLWEEAILASEMNDLNYAKTVFATQGCAACHRLQGFDSNTGFAAEKDSRALELLDKQRLWFRSLFPEVVHYSRYDEELPGSVLVSLISDHKEEIDQNILPDVRTNSILEEINKNYPETIEALYSTFRYAARAKDNVFQEQIKSENNPEKKVHIQKEWDRWKERVHRVLMIYIQTYGLGRLVGPHLNWSGIYRTDEWLMEHFKNPSGHVPRSLMPLFPFDETKFYALTHLLDVLAIQNRDALKSLWGRRGFNPEEAYDTLCAQCHGVGMTGNGVIAEWIYPIPKNLKNPDFLRNLTKEKAVDSITHGVGGTPMAPWGESAGKSALGKETHSEPVLQKREINSLVNWLFSSVSVSQGIEEETDIPKWKYRPEDVVKELRGGKGSLGLNDVHTPEDVFSVVVSPDDRGEKYYIKKEYYTPENIEQGKAFFLLNCAVCHGTEADGSGTRSGAMQDAKPRILTNLDWLDSRDDLRLLRSIKYGVPGTGMTPWGDLTNSLQRLQLIIFIRSLTEEAEERKKIFTTLYQTFQTKEFDVEAARVKGSSEIKALNVELNKLQSDLIGVASFTLDGKKEAKEASEIYQKSLEIEKKIKELQVIDEGYAALKVALQKERARYESLGLAMIGQNVPKKDLEMYREMIRLHSNSTILVDNQFVLQKETASLEKMQSLRSSIVHDLDEKIGGLELELDSMTKEPGDSNQRQAIAAKEAQIAGYKKLRARFIADTAV